MEWALSYADRVAIVGGLIVSQILTLYTTPVVYLYLDKLQSWLLSYLPKRQREEHKSVHVYTD